MRQDARRGPQRRGSCETRHRTRVRRTSRKGATISDRVFGSQAEGRGFDFRFPLQNMKGNRQTGRFPFIFPLKMKSSCISKECGIRMRHGRPGLGLPRKRPPPSYWLTDQFSPFGKPVRTRGATTRVTVNLPTDTLRRARTDTILAGLKALERQERRSALRALKGRVPIDLDLDETRR